MLKFRETFIKGLTLILLITISGVTFGQNNVATMDAPTSVSADEQFQLNITINAKPNAFTPPNLSDFNILMGPSVSTGGITEIINGKMSQSYETTYSYVLQPKKSGKVNISPATFIVNGKKITSNSIAIDVTGTNSSGTNSQGNPQSSSNEQVDENGDIFIRVLVDKNTVYQGEFITASVKLYSRLDISNIAPRHNFSSSNGFFKQDISTPPLRQLRNEKINGKTYGTGVLQKVILIPQNTGQLTIAPYEIICIVDVPVQSFFFNSSEQKQLTLKSKPVKINVKPLPNRPASFTGAVGKFNFTASYDKTKVKQNDPVILKVSVSGAGNLKLIEAPKIDFPEGIETSEPSIVNKTSDKDGGISGTKQFEYLLIPRAPGKLTLPSIEFAYFDPIAGQYKTISSPSAFLEVEPGSASSAVSSSGVAKEDLKFLGKDIQYIKLDDVDLRKSGTALFGSLIFYLLYIIPFILFVTVLIVRRNFIKQNANVLLAKNRKAQKFAVKRLKKAKEYLIKKQKNHFYDEVLKALWGYLSDKLGIPVSSLSRDNAKEQLKQTGVDDETLNKLMQLLDTCEFAQYAPSTSDDTMEGDYSEAKTIITQMQEKIR